MNDFNSIIKDMGNPLGSLNNTLGALGPVISDFASEVGTVIGGIIEALAPIAEALGKFANAFLQGLGVLQPDESVQDLGARAIQGAEQGIYLSNHESCPEYFDSLRNMNFDEAKAASYKTSDKLMAGLAIGTIAAEQKLNLEEGSLSGAWVLPMANPEYFTPERMQNLISVGSLNGDALAYLENKLSGAEASGFRKGLEVNEDGLPMDDEQKMILHEEIETTKHNHETNLKEAERLLEQQLHR